VQRIPFLPRTKLDDTHRLDVLDQTLQNLASQPSPGHLPPTKENRRLDFVSLIQETQYMIFLRLVIVVVYVDPKLDLLIAS